MTKRNRGLMWGALLAVPLLMALILLGNMKPDAPRIQFDKAELSQALASNEPVEIAQSLMALAKKHESEIQVLPESLKGTDVDGGFRVDEQGNLIIDKSIQRYFDYFLATVGELSMAEIATYLRHQISSGLAEPARTQALAILEDYLAFKAALHLAAQQQDGSEGDAYSYMALSERLGIIQQARREHLSPEVVEAFFGEEEQYDQYTLDRIRIEQDSSLTAGQKAEQLESLLQTLPESIRKDQQEVGQYQRYAQVEASMRQEGASAEDLYQMRQQMFGSEAAERFAKLDQERAIWDQKWQQYEAQKLRLQGAGLSDSDYQSQLQELRERHFSEVEIRRVEALDRLAKAS